ncbi:hypothetical protein Val02_79050 [Virgisporangium aliadipatigenens]|uniref:Uncharacterized protein n=2 Tax=Virgisporangium aliadipatigenens TaxID=741659 RepID=A0A8J3YSG5_9ACTN|nr:hypothetical protein Val02_79050 [Virgisporangium aliadipatigenens]
MKSVRRIVSTAVLGVALAGAFASPAMASPHHQNHDDTTKFSAFLRGDGWGVFNATLDEDGRFCYTLFVRDTDADEARIELGRRDIWLNDLRRGRSVGCKWLSDNTAWQLLHSRRNAEVVVEEDGPGGDELEGNLRRQRGDDWQ